MLQNTRKRHHHNRVGIRTVPRSARSSRNTTFRSKRCNDEQARERNAKSRSRTVCAPQQQTPSQSRPRCCILLGLRAALGGRTSPDVVPSRPERLHSSRLPAS
ncbi:hypothetical protein IscW_ISCW010193 [Ixodes scapularis]|uniref:Uncharacterized protein n=1 Tax=Ixodes scapularis TaxID=6945 RepID=B7Q019_IXOSC|nr:hypothetical protein IscW_ISCW010193 [Ixodes scapularis]|eukprot:XP_002406731.1 hypothetical protein IscW_ISCW010193 [Ixodes scapularis]